MKYILQRKLFTIREKAFLYDSDNKIVYKIKSKLFSPTKKRIVYDQFNKKIFNLRKKYFHLLKNYIYIKDLRIKERIATIESTRFLLFDFLVLGYKDEISFKGKWFLTPSEIYKNGKLIATVTPKINLKETFEIEIFEKEDLEIVFNLVLGIDILRDTKS